jgi:YidC/Oxa1 family membrane protein insertase
MALLPLTKIQIFGMKNMQAMQPVMKEIQRFYPNKQDQSAKTMELYQKYKINPLAGCLPMIIQLPILFGVYRALYDPTFAGKDFLGIQLLFPVNVTSGTSFGHGPELSDMVDMTVAKFDLMGQMFAVPSGIPLIGGSYWYLPGLALVVLYIASSLIMQKVMKKVNAPDPAFAEVFKEEMKSPKEDGQPDLAAQMQKQMGLMNFIIIIFAFIFSAGALLYFIVQNSLMMLEYTLIPKLAGGSVALDPKELKQFIRQAPPPAGQQQGAKIIEQRKGGKAGVNPAESTAGNGSIEETNGIGAGQSTATGDEQPRAISRPRRKRKKR